MAKHKKPAEAVRGTYTALPHEIIDSTAFSGASHPARSLLYELLRQHNGRNNGHLHLASPWLKRRGWTSSDVVQRAKQALIKRELIVQCRQGGLNAGASLYALTWLPISNYVGLDIRSTNYQPGAWRFLDRVSMDGNTHNHTVTRSDTAPSAGAVDKVAVPLAGAKTGDSGNATTPSNGNNECYQLPPSNRTSRIVGLKGRSGLPRQNGARPNITQEQ